MKLKNYKFESKEELNYVASQVLSYFGKNINPKDIDYTPIIEYKVGQLKALLGDEYNISPENLMMYLSCPIGVQNQNDINTFGIRTKEGTGNGKINMHLSKMILIRSLFDASTDIYEKLVDEEMDDVDTLPTQSDYLDCYVPSMLKEPELLCYLFFTGRGEEFTRIFADTTFLKRLEDGSFKADEIQRRMSPFHEGKTESSPLLKSIVKEDLLRIKSLAEEKSIQDANRLVK